MYKKLFLRPLFRSQIFDEIFVNLGKKLRNIFEVCWIGFGQE